MLTNKLPDKPGYYWWTDGHERLQILEVTELENGELYAEGGELYFNVNVCDEDDYWAYIKPPKVPKRKGVDIL